MREAAEPLDRDAVLESQFAGAGDGIRRAARTPAAAVHTSGSRDAGYANICRIGLD